MRDLKKEWIIHDFQRAFVSRQVINIVTANLLQRLSVVMQRFN